SLIELLARGTDGITQVVATLAELQAWSAERGGAVADRVAAQLAALTGARPSWAGLSFARPLLMGIVNVTPDSFSDGGDFREHHRAIAQARALLEEGADIIDVGGESTRPGAVPVSVEEEWRRVEPVIRALADAGAVLSIDTRHARVMAAALAAGARIVNDVSALTGEPESVRIVARSKAPVVLMHMQNDPRTMQRAPSYTLASLDIAEYLEDRIAACVAGGIAPDRIVADPCSWACRARALSAAATIRCNRRSACRDRSPARSRAWRRACRSCASTTSRRQGRPSASGAPPRRGATQWSNGDAVAFSGTVDGVARTGGGGRQGGGDDCRAGSRRGRGGGSGPSRRSRGQEPGGPRSQRARPRRRQSYRRRFSWGKARRCQSR